jgi:hypothetical protein
MKDAIVTITFAVLCIGSAFGAQNSPEIQVVDNKLSMNVKAIPLGQLLNMLDHITAMNSTVPAELSNRNVTVRFHELPIPEAIRKIFEAQRIDYVLVWGHGISVIAPSKEAPVQAAYSPFVQDKPPAPDSNQNVDKAPILFETPQKVKAGATPPATIPTPFGQIANPAANTPPAGNNLFGNTSPAIFVDDPQKTEKK